MHMYKYVEATCRFRMVNVNSEMWHIVSNQYVSTSKRKFANSYKMWYVQKCCSKILEEEKVRLSLEDQGSLHGMTEFK